jgi:hypothetical protein
MKIAAMMEAYANATGDRIMHHIGVAEVLVQLIESSKTSRVEAVEQFREAMVGYVNESIDFIKAADMADKDELAKAVRKLIGDMHNDRHDILSGEAPQTPIGEIMAPIASDRRDMDSKLLDGGNSHEMVKPAAGEGTYLPGTSGVSEIDDANKDSRGRKHAA